MLMPMISNGKFKGYDILWGQVFIRNAIDNEAEPNPNRGQEPRQANRGAAREEGKSEQPKNKKKVHTIKN